MDILTQLRRDEGVRYNAYLDILKNWTTGVGHLILSTEQWLLTATLTDDQVDTILNHDVADKERQLIAFPWFNALDEVRQAAITNMAFNLGVQGLLGFPSMIHYLTALNYIGAHDAALDSEWALQLHYDPTDPVASRPGRIAQQILTGAWV
jgi:lysozyme